MSFSWNFEITADSVVAMLSLVVSAGVAVKVFFAGQAAERRERCFRMFELWSSEDFRRCRAAVWDHLERHQVKPGVTSLDYATLKQDSVVFGQLGGIEHFFADLNSMIEEGVVDRDLARRLFQSTVAAWWDYFEHPETNWRENLEWYQSHVRPLLSNLAPWPRPWSP